MGSDGKRQVEVALFAMYEDGASGDAIAEEGGELFDVMRRIGLSLDGYLEAADEADPRVLHLHIREVST